MKKLIFLILAAAGFVAAFPARAQQLYYPPAREAYEADPTIVRGNYTLYDFDTPAPTPAPKGFKPCYISTYNRHGARTYGSNSGYDSWYAVLKAAAADDMLTPAGKELHDIFMALYPRVQLRGGDLTEIGHRQLRLLGMRMWKAYPDLFRKHPVIDARSTTVPRVMLSMIEFCDGLKTCDPTLGITQTASQVDRSYLNPLSSTNPNTIPADRDIESGKDSYRRAYHALMNDHIDADAILGRFLKDLSYAEKGGRSTRMDLCRLLFNVAVDLPCVTDEYDLTHFLTSDELFCFWRAENFRFYSVAGRTPVHRGRNWALEERLLRSIVETAEADLADGKVQVRLRFGHDFYLIGLATLLDVDGWNIEEPDPEKVDAVFRHYCSPTAMNMQFIFYRNDLGDILVRTTLNDREVRFPIAGFEGPYYPWTSFRAYCNSRLSVAKEILSSTK